MAINLTEAQVAELVAKVVREIRSEAPAAGHTWDATQYDGRKFVGVFDTMEEAIAAAEAGYKTIRATSVADREKLISSMRAYCRAEAATMASVMTGYMFIHAATRGTLSTMEERMPMMPLMV